MNNPFLRKNLQLESFVVIGDVIVLADHLYLFFLDLLLFSLWILWEISAKDDALLHIVHVGFEHLQALRQIIIDCQYYLLVLLFWEEGCHTLY